MEGPGDDGLTARGRRILPNDPLLTPIWTAAGELDVPVLIHVADPVAFFHRVDRHNERIEELIRDSEEAPEAERDSRNFRASSMLSKRRSPQTPPLSSWPRTACTWRTYPECPVLLDRYPNLFIDIAGRAPNFGRQPRTARGLLRSPFRPDPIWDGYLPNKSPYPSRLLPSSRDGRRGLSLFAGPDSAEWPVADLWARSSEACTRPGIPQQRSPSSRARSRSPRTQPPDVLGFPVRPGAGHEPMTRQDTSLGGHEEPERLGREGSPLVIASILRPKGRTGVHTHVKEFQAFLNEYRHSVDGSDTLLD